jgi:hypothetical protein
MRRTRAWSGVSGQSGLSEDSTGGQRRPRVETPRAHMNAESFGGLRPYRYATPLTSQRCPTPSWCCTTA